MKNLFLDTCVLIHIIRESETGKKCLQAIENYDENANIIISVVTKAELDSFALQNKWQLKKVTKLNEILTDITIIDISKNDTILLENYAKIDGFSKRKSEDLDGNLMAGSAKKMGKNDLWIASTASTLEIPLLTIDGDFDHLNNYFLKLQKIV